ncbi:MAG: hypothetical protein NTY74_09135 [Ignavibacteriae bacterium]|nr:hypothetical protein [Ignavibacteriota bacterium]
MGLNTYMNSDKDTKDAITIPEVNTEELELRMPEEIKAQYLALLPIEKQVVIGRIAGKTKSMIARETNTTPGNIIQHCQKIKIKQIINYIEGEQLSIIRKKVVDKTAIAANLSIDVLVELLKSKDERIRIKAAMSILDYEESTKQKITISGEMLKSDLL